LPRKALTLGTNNANGFLILVAHENSVMGVDTSEGHAQRRFAPGLGFAGPIAANLDAGVVARSGAREVAIVTIKREQLFQDLVSLRRAMVSAIAMVGA
jgi:hypothetical protein